LFSLVKNANFLLSKNDATKSQASEAVLCLHNVSVCISIFQRKTVLRKRDGQPMHTEIFFGSLFSTLSLSTQFCSTIVLRKTVKTRNAEDRDFSGAHVNQNFPYSTKNLTRSFFRQAGQNALRFSRSRFSFFGRRVFSQNSP
jgi:hypothetical protein